MPGMKNPEWTAGAAIKADTKMRDIAATGDCRTLCGSAIDTDEGNNQLPGGRD
jgi:hypothetical protein